MLGSVGGAKASVDFGPTVLFYERLRFERNPSFLRRTVSHRAPSRSSAERRVTFELALSVSELSGQAHTTVFAMLCDTSHEGEYCVKRAWRLKAAPGADAAGEQRSVLSLPPALLEQRAGLEFVFVVWEARDDLHWLGGAGGACVASGMQGDRVFALVPEGSSVAWCRVPSEDVSRQGDAVSASRAALGKLALARATLRCRAEPLQVRAGGLQHCLLRFEAASALSLQSTPPPQQLHYSISGFRSANTPQPEPVLASESVSRPSPVVVHFHCYYDTGMKRETLKTEGLGGAVCLFCSMACCSFHGLQEHLRASHPHFAYTFSDPVSTVLAVNVMTTAESAKLASDSAVRALKPLAKQFRAQSRRLGTVAALALALPSALFAPLGCSAFSAAAAYTKRRHTESWVDGEDSDDSAPFEAFKLPRTGGAGKLSQDAMPKRMITRVRHVKPVRAATHPVMSLADHAAAGQFYHARTAMVLHPTELDGVYQDSDDDVDEQHWQTKCRRGIDEFADVTRVEKEFMVMWNAYTHKRHIYADALLPTAVAEFARLHRSGLCADPELRRCFTLHLVNLWDMCLLDGAAIDEAQRLLEAGE